MSMFAAGIMHQWWYC